jgi:hypothetical protein
MAPFQGLIESDLPHTQGVALGYRISAFQAAFSRNDIPQSQMIAVQKHALSSKGEVR